MGPAPPTRRVFLIGFMGAGKTTVGRVLAGRLGCPFQDLDDVIEQSQGKSVARIFAESGEQAFRAAESAALRQVLEESDDEQAGLVLALGGGAFAQLENRQALHRSGGVIVLLQAPVEELRRRCAGESGRRPLAVDPVRFEKLFAERKAAYDLAPLRVETMNKSVEHVAAEIESMITVAARLEVKK